MIQEIFFQISILEWIGVSFAIVQVLLSRVNNPINYLFGICSVSITMYLMFQSKLYAEFTLNIYYLIKDFRETILKLQLSRNTLISIMKSIINSKSIRCKNISYLRRL